MLHVSLNIKINQNGILDLLAILPKERIKKMLFTLIQEKQLEYLKKGVSVEDFTFTDNGPPFAAELDDSYIEDERELQMIPVQAIQHSLETIILNGLKKIREYAGV